MHKKRITNFFNKTKKIHILYALTILLTLFSSIILVVYIERNVVPFDPDKLKVYLVGTDEVYKMVNINDSYIWFMLRIDNNNSIDIVVSNVRYWEGDLILPNQLNKTYNIRTQVSGNIFCLYNNSVTYNVEGYNSSVIMDVLDNYGKVHTVYYRIS